MRGNKSLITIILTSVIQMNVPHLVWHEFKFKSLFFLLKEGDDDDAVESLILFLCNFMPSQVDFYIFFSLHFSQKKKKNNLNIIQSHSEDHTLKYEKKE